MSLTEAIRQKFSPPQTTTISATGYAVKLAVWENWKLSPAPRWRVVRVLRASYCTEWAVCLFGSWRSQRWLRPLNENGADRVTHWHR